MKTNLKADVLLVDQVTNTLISTISFNSLDKQEADWLSELVQRGTVKYSITVRYK